MASGFFALLDDIASIAKIAVSSLDDVAAQALKAGNKTAGIVIDDAAVTPRYVVGFAAERELPIIAKIAWGSLKNKTLYLLPGALALSVVGALGHHAAADGGRRVPVLRGLREGARSAAPVARSGAGGGGCDRGGRREGQGRQRDPYRLHPVGRDHGDHTGGGDHPDVHQQGRGAGPGGRARDRCGLRHGRAHREGGRLRALPRAGRSAACGAIAGRGNCACDAVAS